MIEVGKLFNCRKNSPDDDHHALSFESGISVALRNMLVQNSHAAA